MCGIAGFFNPQQQFTKNEQKYKQNKTQQDEQNLQKYH